jgi:hypothetical protein
VYPPYRRDGEGGGDERFSPQSPQTFHRGPSYTTRPPRPSGRAEPLRVDVGRRDVRSVYLGGNIMRRNDWRRTLVSGLGLVGVAPMYPSPPGILWPRMPGAVVGRFDYVGPYSISGDPDDDAEWNSENDDEGTEWVVSGPLVAPQRGPRVNADPYMYNGQTQPTLSEPAATVEVWWPLVRAARQVKKLALAAIREADLYFAWIDTPLCAATQTEVGWANAKGKILWIAGPQPFDEMWLLYTLADQYTFRYQTPAEAFQNMLQLALAGNR